uniref:Uncharacterized protein n=1 Tax=Lepeophtheirus salmonis TaxID=72036 RepID=A0A0K2UHL4_LEPSM
MRCCIPQEIIKKMRSCVPFPSLDPFITLYIFNTTSIDRSSLREDNLLY